MMTNLRRPLKVATLAFTLSATAFTPFRAFAGSEAPFHIDSTWKLGGNGSWDYLAVDATAHLLYIARLDRIMSLTLKLASWRGKSAACNTLMVSLSTIEAILVTSVTVVPGLSSSLTVPLVRRSRPCPLERIQTPFCSNPRADLSSSSTARAKTRM